MSNLWQDLRLALRGMWKQPGFTAIAIITLALGIGSNTAIFSVINALILKSPHITEAERVVVLWGTAKDKRSTFPASYLDLQDLRAQNHTFESIAAYKPNGFTLVTEQQAERIQGMRVTANFLSLLKVAPVIGRDFQVEEEKRGSKEVVIISDQFWRERFNSDASAVGRELTLDGKPFTIIGVLPNNFEFPLAARSSEVLTTVAAEGGNLDERGAHVFLVIGRLNDNVSFAQARADLTNISANLERAQLWRNFTTYLVPVDEEIVGSEVRRGLWVLLGAVVFLLLIA